MSSERKVLNPEINKYINQSVLCWLATSSADNVPNVSPKEIFAILNDTILIANIASPQTIKNIEINENVCLSFIDIYVQKGYQLKGRAKIIKESDTDFSTMKKVLEKLTSGKFPFSSVTQIWVEKAKPIIAPGYLFFPETTEQQQIENAIQTYQSKLNL